MSRLPLSLGLALLAARLAAAPLQPSDVAAFASSGGGTAAGFTLSEPGSKWLVDYSQYGTFKDVGSPRFQYIMTKPSELAAATGEGIYPNTSAVLRDPGYLMMKGSLSAVPDKGFFAGPPAKAQENFYRWATSTQPDGVKLFFEAESLKDAGLWVPALKAYHALLVQFPDTTRLADAGTWGQALGAVAISRIKLICREHPDLGLDLVDAEVEVDKPGMLDEKVLRLNPGRFVARKTTPPDLGAIGIKQIRGKGKVQLVQYNNGHWSLFVDRKPYFVKGLVYGMTKIGQSPDLQNMTPWELGNDPEPWTHSWVDANRNNKRDPGETENDLDLMKGMGINTLRLYFGGSNKAALRNLYKEAGIRVMMGAAAGVYALDSGATWEQGTDYTNEAQQQKMLDGIKAMVLLHKDEPYILMWCLGNENNYGGGNNSPQYPATFAAFLQKACKLIHRLDPDHPVCYSNGDVGFLDYYVRHVPDLDIFGANVYRGKDGVGDLYEKVSKDYDRPVLITEFGAPAFSNNTHAEDQDAQADYLEGNLKDMAYNRAGGLGAGNA
jgi:hypothetical protein